MLSASRFSLPPSMATTTTTQNPHHPSPFLRLNINGLYILLGQLGNIANRWHWGLYLHRGLRSGWIMHATNPEGVFVYDQQDAHDVAFWETIVAALQIGDEVPPDMHEALRDRIAQVPVADADDMARFGTANCRSWLLRAVEALDNEGYISLAPGTTAETIEDEATDLASSNAVLGGRSAAKSKYLVG